MEKNVPVFTNDFARRILNDLPAVMRNDLRDCITPEQAELVFYCYQDIRDVPPEHRGFCWLHA
jgi:hypothetical protein